MTLPAVPWIDSPALGTYLDGSGAEPETRAFAHALARDGLASLQLGPELTPLLDRVVADMTPWLARPGARRAQDLWRRSEAVRRVAGSSLARAAGSAARAAVPSSHTPEADGLSGTQIF